MICALQFRSCFFCSKSDLAVPTGTVKVLASLVREAMTRLSTVHKPALLPPMRALNVDAGSLGCREAAAWASNCDGPFQLVTNVAQVPLLLLHLAVALGITFTAHRWHCTGVSMDAICMVITFGCLRSSTHRNDTTEMPTLLCSYVWDSDVHSKSKQRPTPPVECNCPFKLYVRIDLPFATNQERICCSSMALLSCRATVELPLGNNHGSTHSPRPGVSPLYNGVLLAPTPTTTGEALDDFHFPLHPDITAFVCYLHSQDLDTATITRLAQAYATWLHPIFVKYPDVSTAAAPHRVICQSTGFPPPCSLKNNFVPDNAGVLDGSVIDSEHCSSGCETATACDFNGSGCESAASGSGGCEPTVARVSGCDSVADEPEACSQMDVHENGSCGAATVSESPDDSPLALLSSAATQISADVLKSHAIADGLEEVVITRATPLLSLLQNLHLPHAFSCFSWFLTETRVSSFTQWLQLRRRGGKNTWAFFLQDFLPAYIDKTWAAVNV